MTDDALPDPTLLNVLHAERLRWIFVGGKGGVGKTTTSCALACQLASVRKSVLLISTDPAHNLSDAFRQKFTRSPTPVNGVPNLFAMEVDPTPDDAAAALVGAGGPAADAAAFLGDLATAVPGIDEAMAFAEVMRQVTALDHDAIVFDTAPTGHTLRLLQFPATLQKGLDKLMSLRGAIGGALGALGPLMGAPADAQAALMGKLEELKSVVDEVNTQFTDPDRTTFVCVCIPEFLSLYETERLVQALAGFKIDCRNVCINQVIAPGAAGTSVLLAARARMQATYLAQFEELYEDFHLVRTPLLAEEVRGVDALKAFSTFLVDPAAAAAAGAALAAPGGGGGGGSAREAELVAEVAALKDKVGKLEVKCARWSERWAVCGPDDYDGWTTPSDEEGGGV